METTLKPTTSNSPRRNKNAASQWFIPCFLCVIVISFVSCKEEDDGPGDPVSQQDRTFAVDASYSNLAEIEMGLLGLSKGTDVLVLEFAELMVTDHTVAQNELSNIAQSLEVTIPDTLKSAHQVLYQQLSAFEGAAFDSAYISSQIPAHQEAQQIFQTQINQGQNSLLKENASNILPHVNMHLQSAIALKEDLQSTEGME